MARKPLSGKTVADNVIEWGTGGINIDESRIETTDNLDRFPANIIFDEEAGKLLDEQYITEVSRFFYCPKTSKSDRNEGTDNNHPTVKPTDLMLYLIRLVTPKGGTTLDPFMGSGSTGKAAIRGGFDFIGIEREKEYLQIAESRINYEINNPYKEEKDKTVEVKSQVIDKLNQFFE
jgi:site-specific DNA-methyltransferase (adenine-specific)